MFWLKKHSKSWCLVKNIWCCCPKDSCKISSCIVKKISWKKSCIRKYPVLLPQSRLQRWLKRCLKLWLSPVRSASFTYGRNINMVYITSTNLQLNNTTLKTAQSLNISRVYANVRCQHLFRLCFQPKSDETSHCVSPAWRQLTVLDRLLNMLQNQRHAFVWVVLLESCYVRSAVHFLPFEVSRLALFACNLIISRSCIKKFVCSQFKTHRSRHAGVNLMVYFQSQQGKKQLAIQTPQWAEYRWSTECFFTYKGRLCWCLFFFLFFSLLDLTPSFLHLQFWFRSKHFISFILFV